MQLTGKETLLAISILAFLVIGIIFLFRKYFKNLSEKNLCQLHDTDTKLDTLNSRVKYEEVNVLNWTRPFFLMGLAASISFTLFAFSWTTEYQHEAYGMNLEPVEDIEIDVERTQHPKPTPPIPPPPPKIEIPVEIIPEELVESFIDETIDETDAIEEPVENAEQTDGTGEVMTQRTPPPTPVYIEDEPPIIIAEQMPRFPGCENIEGTRKEKQKCAEKKLMEYIYDNLEYPKMAIDNTIQGRVTLRFVVDTDGKISNVKILRDLGGGCGAAAAQAVKSMNDMPERWTPGKQRGKPVKVLYTLPIQFRLN